MLRKIVFLTNYPANFHMQILMAAEKAVDYYKQIGFEIAGNTRSMRIYQGN